MIDIPCDVQNRDRAGRVWAFLDEAADPEVVVVGRLVVTGDEEGPVIARVLDISQRPGGMRVTMSVIGAAGELVAVLRRAGLVERS